MYKSILVPVDLSHGDLAKKMIKKAAELADRNASVVALHVVPEIPTYVSTEIPASILVNAKRMAQEQLTKMVEACGVDVDIEVRTGHPRAAILAAAQEGICDLIIIGSHKPGVQDFVLGSTASRIVRYAKCSVLVTR